MKRLRSTIASLLIVCIAGLGVPLPAQAGMLPTEAAVMNADRGRLASLLDREDVRLQLEARGVTPGEVKARIAALTDEEAATLAARMDELPAGGILGVLLVVFLVLLVTDILGLTKVFPFTRPVK
ncbi:MAG TPA: PA2779 family protein [Burkholderiales bacterium]|nr:PA2779 family protein [Burkholderiales bacterium]